MMKKIKFYLMPFCFLLVPVYSEQHIQESPAENVLEKDIDAIETENNFQTTSEQLYPNADFSGCLGVQQQGKSSVYDRHSSDQNHHSTLPQTAGQNIVQSQEQTSIEKVATSGHKYTNTSARPPLSNALNLWVNGEALLWQATEENLTYVYQTDLAGNNALKTVDFQWDWGFRISGGYNAPYDGWDLSLTWTHLENNASDSSKAHLDENGNGIDDRPFLQAAWGINDSSPPGGVLAKASAHWDVHLDQVDFGLGREYYVGKHLTIRPNGGMRVDWIDQEYKVTYTPFSIFNPQKFKMDNRFFGFGFFAGVDSDWLLGRGFSLYGMADFAILLGFFDVDQTVRQGATKGELDNSFRSGRAILDLNLGLKWCHLFVNNSWGITFKAGYEYHLYFKQNQFSNITMTTSPFQYSKTQGDLAYQGVAFSGQFDF